jgi:large subunit ribosomal protein L25
MATLTAQKREVVRKGLGALRRSGQLPAVVYGANAEPFMVQLPIHESTLTINRAAQNTIFDLSVDDKAYRVVVKEVQREKLTGKPTHVDFLLV